MSDHECSVCGEGLDDVILEVCPLKGDTVCPQCHVDCECMESENPW